MEKPVAPVRPFQHCRAIISIDDQVRTILNLYLELFQNYDEAARRLHVSRDTLGSYVTTSANMADYVFERMAAVVQEHFTDREIGQRLGGFSLADLKGRIHRSNLRQTDHVVCVITPAVRKLLTLHSSCFRSRSRAAMALAINPRTFKAYFSGQISAFPCNKLQDLISLLITEHGHTEEELLQAIEAESWNAVFQKREHAPTLDISTRELVDRFEPFFHSGRLANSQIDRSLLNLSKRVDGCLGKTLRRVMAALANRQERRVMECLRSGNLQQAQAELARWETYIASYKRKLAATNRALPTTKKGNWHQDILRLMEHKNELAAEVGEASAMRHGAASARRLSTATETVDKAYSPDNTYKPGDRLVHATFGSGVVIAVEARNQIRVRFPGSGKLLLRGRASRA
jgi:hypothetical protein